MNSKINLINKHTDKFLHVQTAGAAPPPPPLTMNDLQLIKNDAILYLVSLGSNRRQLTPDEDTFLQHYLNQQVLPTTVKNGLFKLIDANFKKEQDKDLDISPFRSRRRKRSRRHIGATRLLSEFEEELEEIEDELRDVKNKIDSQVLKGNNPNVLKQLYRKRDDLKDKRNDLRKKIEDEKRNSQNTNQPSQTTTQVNVLPIPRMSPISQPTVPQTTTVPLPVTAPVTTMSTAPAPTTTTPQVFHAPSITTPSPSQIFQPTFTVYSPEYYIPIPDTTQPIATMIKVQDRSRYLPYIILLYDGSDNHTKFSLLYDRLIDKALGKTPTPSNIQFDFNDQLLRNDMFDIPESRLTETDTNPEWLYLFCTVAYNNADNKPLKSINPGTCIGCKISASSNHPRAQQIIDTLRKLSNPTTLVHYGVLATMANIATFSVRSPDGGLEKDLNFYTDIGKLSGIYEVQYKSFKDIYSWFRHKLFATDLDCIKDVTKHIVNFDQLTRDLTNVYQYGTIPRPESLLSIFNNAFFDISEASKLNKIVDYMTNRLQSILLSETNPNDNRIYTTYNEIIEFFTIFVKEMCYIWVREYEHLNFDIKEGKHLLKMLHQKLLSESSFDIQQSTREVSSFWDKDIFNNFDFSSTEVDRDEYGDLFYIENGLKIPLTREAIMVQLDNLKQNRYTHMGSDCWGLDIEPQIVNGKELKCTQFIHACLIQDQNTKSWNVCKQFLSTPGFWNKLYPSVRKLDWKWILFIMKGLHWDTKYDSITINGKQEEIKVFVSYEEWLDKLEAKGAITVDEKIKIASNEKFRGFIDQLIIRVNNNPAILNKHITFKNFDIKNFQKQTPTAVRYNIKRYERPYTNPVTTIKRYWPMVGNKIIDVTKLDLMKLYGSYSPKIVVNPSSAIQIIRSPNIIARNKYNVGAEKTYLDLYQRLDEIQGFSPNSKLTLTSVAPFLKINYMFLIRSLKESGVELHPEDIKRFNHNLNILEKSENQVNRALELIRIYLEQVENTGFRRYNTKLTLSNIEKLIEKHNKKLNKTLDLRASSLNTLDEIVNKLNDVIETKSKDNKSESFNWNEVF